MISLSASSSLRTQNTINRTEEDAETTRVREEFWFPLFSEISRKAYIPSIFYLIQLAIHFFQVMSSFLFIGSTHIWREGMPRYMIWISYSLNLGVNEVDFTNAYPQYLFIIGYSVLLALYLLILRFQYMKQHWFENFQLYLVHILFSIVNNVLFLISLTLFAYSIVEVYHNSNSYTIFMCILILLSTIFLYTLVAINQVFVSSSPYINRSLTALWDGKLMNYIILAIGLAGFFVQISNVFDKWLIWIFSLVNICGLLHNYYLSSYFICIHFWVTSVVHGFICFGIANSLMVLFKYYVIIDPVIMISVPIVIFPISCVICYIINIKRRNKILNYLMGPDHIMTEMEKYQYFDSKYFSNENDLIMYIHVGVSYHSPLILDFTFIKYALDNYQLPNIVFTILQVVSLFPSEQQLFSYCMSIAINYEKDIRLSQAYLLYQVRRVNYIRQRAMSKEASKELVVIQKMADDTIAQVRGFWAEILHSSRKISLSSLRLIRKSTIETDTAFYNIYEKYPHAQQINDSYCRFLVEAMGSYEKALHYAHKMSQIERGKHVIIDYSYRSFVNAFPSYLRKRILDVRGMRILDVCESQVFSSEISDSNSQTSNTDMEQINDRTAATLFTHSGLRIALDKSMSHSKLKSLTNAKIISLVQLAFTIPVFICIMIFLPYLAENPLNLLESNLHSANIAASISYLSLLACSTLLRSDIDKNLSSIVINRLSITHEDLPTWPSLFQDKYLAMHQTRLDLLTELDAEMALIMDKPSLHSQEIIFFNTDNDSRTLIAIDNAIQIRYFNLTLRNGINYFSSLVNYLTSQFNEASEDEYNITIKYIEIVLNGQNLAQQYKNVFYEINNVGTEYTETARDYVIILTIVVFVIIFIIFVSIRFITLHKLMVNLDTMSNIIRKVNEEDINQSMKPIYLKSKRHLPTGNVCSAHLFNGYYVIYPLLVTISIAFSCLISFSSCFVYSNQLGFMSNVFLWTCKSAERCTAIMNFLIQTIFDTQSNATTLAAEVNSLFNTSRFLDLELIENDFDFDSFYFTDRCHLKSNSNFAKYVDCISLNNKINLGVNYYNLMIGSMQNFEVFQNYFFASLFIIDKYLYRELINFTSVLNEYAKDLFNSTNANVLLICIGGIIGVFLFFVCESYILSSLTDSHDAFKQLILVLPPESVIKNTAIVDFIMGRSKNKTDQMMSVQESIISAYDDAMVSLDGNLIIQNVNPGFVKLTGFTLDQTLGQAITWLFPLDPDEMGIVDSSSTSFYQKLQEIQNGQDDRAFNISGKCGTDNNGLLPVAITIIAMKSKENKLENLVLIIKDKTPENELKKQIELIREKTEHILSTCVPLPVLTAVRSTNKPQLFYSESATFIAIEVEGINNYIHAIEPKILMENIRFVFKQFNLVVSKFPLLYNIENDLDMFTCASGVFKDIGKHKEQAECAIKFMNAILDGVDELNEHLSSDLHFRMSAHLGGPSYGTVSNVVTPILKVYSPALVTLIEIQRDGDVDQIRCTESLINHLEKSAYAFMKLNVVDGEQIFSVKSKIIKPKNSLMNIPKLEKPKNRSLHAMKSMKEMSVLNETINESEIENQKKNINEESDDDIDDKI
ncbi:hypothetical protein TRFO_34730 [Tritrichomonas foetus]|uniref:PAS domain-containing protein n=1 Tax=Tritrichomonas foetus TaxID=1144522 RepID=A0A1J4JIG1_9EUKA|nr:hypothetical protein TRFO_34730 [Tritrichomonas foetus]|eukprot:OHS98930.1 hypothetical protein TRFO_34730 [Tritrichomonas foetus]